MNDLKRQLAELLGFKVDTKTIPDEFIGYNQCEFWIYPDGSEHLELPELQVFAVEPFGRSRYLGALRRRS